MQKIGIIYFSGTGNTAYVAGTMKKQLEKRDIQVDLINIEKDSINPREYDGIILGGPVYVERYPENLLKYAEKNLVGYRKKCMLFSTQGTDKGTVTFQHAINRLSFLHITYCQYFYMPNNFYNFMFKKFTEEARAAAIKAIPESCEKSLGEFIEGKTQFYSESSIKVYFIDKVYKLVYPHCIGLITRKIKVDRDKCVDCRLCEKNCPTGAVKVRGKVLFSNRCLLCQRCMSNCPKKAFMVKDKPYDQYRFRA